MAGGPGGKIFSLHLHSAENDYYNCYDVLQTKSSIHGVLETILNFVVCYTQNYIFTVSCRQISQKQKSWGMLMAQRIRGKGFAGYYLEGAGVC